ncbi:MAG: hypothetical protein ACOC56_01175 [Atribacterota bacterium]
MVDEIEQYKKEYEAFSKKMVAGDWKDGYEVFRQNPDIVEFMGLIDMGDAYGDLVRHVGPEEAKKFRETVKSLAKKT